MSTSPTLPMNNNTAGTDESNGNEAAAAAVLNTAELLEIDSALQAALRDPRERMGLLKLEQALIDFINAPDASWLEVGGLGNAIVLGPSVTQQAPLPSDYRPATSFQRCLCHRLADRFSIARENGSLLEASIRLLKISSDSKIPEQLLRDVDMTAESQQHPSEQPMMMIASPDPPKKPKMKVMKRKDSNTSNSSSRQSKAGGLAQARSSGSLTDKERAYEEARARIFGLESSEQGEDADDAAGSAQQFVPAMPLADYYYPSADATAGASRELSSSSLGNMHASSSSSNLESKAVYRNRQEEAADPDFQRNVVVYPQQAYPPAYPVAPQQQIAAAAPMMMYPSTIFTPASSSPATAYYNHYPPPAAVPTTTTKSHDLTADAPAFYPSFGQQQQQL